MSVNIESGKFKYPNAQREKINAPSVTEESAILLTWEASGETGNHPEMYVYDREPGVGFHMFLETAESKEHWVNWVVIN